MLENSHTMEMSFFFFWDLDVFMNLSRRRIQDLSEGGADPKGGTNLLCSQFFLKTAWKWRKLGRGRHVRFVYVDPPLGAKGGGEYDSKAEDFLIMQLKHFFIDLFAQMQNKWTSWSFSPPDLVLHNKAVPVG